MPPTCQSYGKDLPDQVDRITAVFDAHLGLISDIRELHRERVILERDYATKLQALAKKASERKAKTTAALVLGEEPTKIWDESALRQSTLDNAYSQIIASMTLSAQDHFNLSDAITSQVIDVLKSVEKKNEEAKKKQTQFYQKLLSNRDKIYSERVKSKQKYDDECMEVEASRQKQGHAGDRHTDRAAKQYEQQLNDMSNCKNLYLISTAIANSTKSKFYSEDLQDLENSFQDMQTRLVYRFASILLQAQALQLSHQDTLKGRIASADKAIKDIDTVRDQDLFIDHNIRPFVAPGNWTFEPCSGHYDTGEMNVDPASKVFIQNKLVKCRTKLQELVPLIETKRKDVDKYANLIASYAKNGSLGNIEEVSDDYLDAKQQLTFLTSSERILTTEIDVIIAALGGDEGAQMPHTFKSSSFSIPTQCGYCKTSIWGLSKQGKTCRACGLSVHSKCELKVPAECGSSSGGSKRPILSVARIATRNSIGSSAATTPITSSSATSPVQNSYPSARVLFEFSPTSTNELAVSEGAIVHVLEEDDGSGWVKVIDNQGGEGLVPASYVSVLTTLPVRSRSGQGSQKYVRGLYDYRAQESNELDLTEGELVELSAGPNGGQNYANGWWEGINKKGEKGIFPSNYVELA